MPITVTRWTNPTTWNDFVASSPDAHFQQGWEWGTLAADLGSHAFRLAAVENGEPVAAMQVFVNPLSSTGKTHLYVPRGPVLCHPRLQALAPLLEAAQTLGTEHRAIGLKVEPNVRAGDRDWQAALLALGLRPLYPPSQPRSAWVLDITPEPDALLAAMKQKTRYNIRLSERKGVEIGAGEPKDVDAFYDLYRATALRDDFFIHPKSFYERMFALYWEARSFHLLLARFRGTLLAAVTLLRLGKTCWYVHGASSTQHRNLMAPYLLQWHAIQWARQQGCTLYDFRAVPDMLREDQDMYGVYRFKEGFGGKQLTVLDTYALPYSRGWFGLWQLYFRGRFDLTGWQRRRQGLPARQFA